MTHCGGLWRKSCVAVKKFGNVLRWFMLSRRNQACIKKILWFCTVFLFILVYSDWYVIFFHNHNLLDIRCCLNWQFFAYIISEDRLRCKIDSHHTIFIFMSIMSVTSIVYMYIYILSKQNVFMFFRHLFLNIYNN